MAADGEVRAFLAELRADITVGTAVVCLDSLSGLAEVQDELTVAHQRRNLASLRKFIMHFPEFEHRLVGEVLQLLIS